MQLGLIAMQQLDDREPDWIGTKRRASGEDSVPTIIRRWRAEQFKVLCPVELPDDEQMREAFDIRKPEFEIGKDRDHALCIMPGSKPFGYVTAVLIGSAYKADGPRRKHIRLDLHICVLSAKAGVWRLSSI